MEMLKKIGEGILLGGIVLLIFLLLTEQYLHIPLWLQVAGRMHPMFVHFPIVLLLLSFGIYWIGMPEPENSWSLVIRLLAAISAVITAIMGFLLAVEDGRSGTLLEWHKWGGVALALAGFAFYLFYDFLRRNKTAGKLMTLFASAGIVFTGHFGANLTHGEHYLMEPLNSKEKKVVPLDQVMVFENVIEPILEKKCGSCHAEGNIKGGLVLLDSGGLERGGKTGPLFIPGDPTASLLIKRITMPPDQKKHMPPLSKPGLTLEEISLLKAWIRSGPVINKRLISISTKDSFYLLAIKSLGPAGNIVPEIHYDFPPADEKIVKTLNNNYRAIEPQGAGSPALSVHFYGIKMYSRKSLEELLTVKRQIIQLSLARMPVTDDEADVIAQMINLQTLNLNYTDITSKALKKLTNLKKLKEISLAGTKIDVASLMSICALPEMESVYVWNIKFDSAAFHALRTRYAKLDIQSGFVDNGQFVVELSPPLIQTAPGISDSTLLIKLKHPLRGADIRYTLDGKLPDSVNGISYSQPFPLDTGARLRVRAFHKGWLGSSPVQADYIRRTAKPDSIELTSNPDPKYKYLSGKLLSDKDLGGTDIYNGQWLGYQKTPAVYYLDYDAEARVHSVLLNVLLDTGSNIFPPVRVQVWGGMDRNHLRYLAKIEPDSAKDKSTRAVLEKINFGSQHLKYLKIVAEPKPLDAYLRRLKKKDPWMYISEIVVN